MADPNRYLRIISVWAYMHLYVLGIIGLYILTSFIRYFCSFLSTVSKQHQKLLIYYLGSRFINF